jgi:hypothetical protein
LNEEQAHDEAHTEAETNPLETETNQDKHAVESTDSQLHASDYSIHVNIHHSPVSSASASLQDDRTRLESKIEKISTELKSPNASEAKQFALKKKMAMCRADLIKLERRIDAEKAQQVCIQALAVWGLGFRVDVEKAEKGFHKLLPSHLLCSCDARDQTTLMSVGNLLHPRCALLSSANRKVNLTRSLLWWWSQSLRHLTGSPKADRARERECSAAGDEGCSDHDVAQLHMELQGAQQQLDRVMRQQVCARAHARLPHGGGGAGGGGAGEESERE